MNYINGQAIGAEIINEIIAKSEAAKQVSEEAKSAADAANVAASSASGAASAAAANATHAAASAMSAATSAEAAQLAAGEANTKAAEAVGKASEARDTANEASGKINTAIADMERIKEEGRLANLVPVSITASRWSEEEGDYWLTILGTEHNMGVRVVAVALPKEGEQILRHFYDDFSYNQSNGDITLKSGTAWEGEVYVIGGITQLVDVEARSSLRTVELGLTTKADNETTTQAIAQIMLALTAAQASIGGTVKDIAFNAETGELALIKNNGEVEIVDISELASKLAGAQTSTIDVDVSGDAISATLRSGAVTLAHLSDVVVAFLNSMADKSTVYTKSDVYTKAETDAEIDAAIEQLTGVAPSTLDTLGEIAAAIEEHRDEYGALVEAIGGKASKTELNAVSAALADETAAREAEDIKLNNELKNKASKESLEGFTSLLASFSNQLAEESTARQADYDQLNNAVNQKASQAELNSISGNLDAEAAARQAGDAQLLEEINTRTAAKVDKEGGKGLSSNDFTTDEKQKLAGIENNANRYEHPENHPPSIITQDAGNRFVTDEEKAKWSYPSTANLYGLAAKSQIISANTNFPNSETHYPFVGTCADGTIEKVTQTTSSAGAGARTFTTLPLALFKNIFYLSGTTAAWQAGAVCSSPAFSRAEIDIEKGTGSWRYAIGIYYNKAGASTSNGSPDTDLLRTPLYVGGTRNGDYFVPSEYSLTLRDSSKVYKQIGYFGDYGKLFFTDVQPVFVYKGGSWREVNPLTPDADETTKGIATLGSEGGAAKYTHQHLVSDITDFPDASVLETLVNGGKGSILVGDNQSTPKWLPSGQYGQILMTNEGAGDPFWGDPLNIFAGGAAYAIRLGAWGTPAAAAQLVLGNGTGKNVSDFAAAVHPHLFEHLSGDIADNLNFSTADKGIVNKAGTLRLDAAGSIYFYRHGVGLFWTETANNAFSPWANDGNYTLGSSAYKWGKTYTQKLNNGADINIPNKAGTVELEGHTHPPYVQNVTWSGTVGNYSYTLTAAQHGKGTDPLPQCLHNGKVIDCEPYIAANGDVTIYSNANLSGVVLKIR